jgi:hypothetical protein
MLSVLKGDAAARLRSEPDQSAIGRYITADVSEGESGILIGADQRRRTANPHSGDPGRAEQLEKLTPVHA